MAIQISGCEVIDNSRCLQNIVNACFSACANTFVTRDADGRIQACKFSRFLPSLGSAYEGGYLISASGSVGWILAPSGAGVSRNWYCRNDAVTTANASATCGDWFIPTVGQLQSPGFTCRVYWDSYSNNNTVGYWSNTEATSTQARGVRFSDGFAFCSTKSNIKYVRAFRCITY